MYSPESEAVMSRKNYYRARSTNFSVTPSIVSILVCEPHMFSHTYLCVCLCHQCCKFIQNPLSFSVALEVHVRSYNQYVLCPSSLQDAFISMVSVYAFQLVTAFFLVTFNSLKLLTCLAYFYMYLPLIPKWKENKC